MLRLPSLFEPPWHTDEGIFAAVAQRVLEGGQLYRDAWESKPPLFLYVYVATFKVFGPGVFGLHLVATLSAVATHVALFFVARRLMSMPRALAATGLCGLLLGVPFWEGQLALTEVFTVLPTTLGVLAVLAWQDAAGPRPARVDGLVLLAGALFGLAFLLRQTSLAGAGAAGLWLLLSGAPWRRAALLAGLGFALCVAPVVGVFWLSGDFHWFWDANVTFFLKYVPSGQQLPFATRPVIILPFLVTAAALALARARDAATPRWGLPALWLTLTLAGALLTGRPYSHYFLQAFPPLALLVAMAAPGRGSRLRLSWSQAPALLFCAALVLEWAYVVVPTFGGNVLAMHYTRGPDYYLNFAEWAIGRRSQADYDNYFDRRVAYTRSLEQVLRRLHAQGQKVYIWGEYPWVYPLAGVQPTTRYMTSFYVLLLPRLDAWIGPELNQDRPRYIVVMSDARPRMSPPSPVIDHRYDVAAGGLEAVLARDYQLLTTVGRARVYVRSPAPNSGLTPEPGPGP